MHAPSFAAYESGPRFSSVTFLSDEPIRYGCFAPHPLTGEPVAVAVFAEREPAAAFAKASGFALLAIGAQEVA